MTSELSDEIAGEFGESADVQEALDQYARGLLTKLDLAEILENELIHAKRRAEDKLLLRVFPDDPLAYVGTCGADYRSTEKEPVEEIDEHEEGIPA